jgi:hypothetical protein
MMGLHENPRGRQAIEISSVFTGLAVIVVALRLYTRFFIIRCAGIEDFGTGLAMVSEALAHTRYVLALTILKVCSIGLTICIGARSYASGRTLV